MYYLLAPQYQLVGYKKLPFALYDLQKSRAEFLNREQFSVAYHCDGQHDLEREELSPSAGEFLQSLLHGKFVTAAAEPGRLKPYQEYTYFDNCYKETVHWSVTGRCNYRCKHCFMSAPGAKFGHPTLEQCLDFIAQMEQCGIKSVSITGGEPLVRDDFMELVAAFTRHHIRITSLLTNGALVDEKLLDGLEHYRQHPSVQMSYDGKGWHDWMRGVDGAEDKVLRAFRLLRDRGYSTSSSMAVHRFSIGSLRESVLTLRDAGCGALKVNVAYPSGEWLNHPEYFLSMDEAYNAYLDYIPEYFEDDAPLSIMLEGAFNYDPGAPVWNMILDKDAGDRLGLTPVCAVLRSSVYVAPEGQVLPCQSMISAPILERYPNVFQTPLRDILTDSAYLDDVCSNVSRYMENNPECAACSYAGRCCGGCRAMGVGADGTDFFAPDKRACEFYRNGWYEKFKAVADREFQRFAESGGVERGAKRFPNRTGRHADV